MDVHDIEGLSFHFSFELVFVNQQLYSLMQRVITMPINIIYPINAYISNAEELPVPKVFVYWDYFLHRDIFHFNNPDH